jgi:hypothetical protein
MTRCVTRLLESAVKSKSAANGYDVNVVPAIPIGMSSFGDESSTTGLKITLSKGISVDLFADIVYVRVGRSLGIYTHVSDNEESTCSEFSPPGCVAFNDLITTATNRLATSDRRAATHWHNPAAVTPDRPL